MFPIKHKQEDSIEVPVGARIGARAEASVIDRREITPLLEKAQKALKYYEEATGCTVSVRDLSGHSIESVQNQPEEHRTLVHGMLFPKDGRAQGFNTSGQTSALSAIKLPRVEAKGINPFGRDKKNPGFCEFCKTHASASSETRAGEEYPCIQKHINDACESRRMGGAYIYLCKMGFTFWACPLFSGGRHVGLVIAGYVLGIKREKAEEKIRAFCGAGADAGDLPDLLKEIPEKDPDEVKSLAKILMTCVGVISGSRETSLEPDKGPDRQESDAAIAEEPAGDQVPQKRGNQNAAEGGCSLDKERLFLAALRQGDINGGLKILDELIDIFRAAGGDDFEFIQFRAIDLVTLLSRTGIGNGSENSKALEANSRSIKRLQESQSIEELVKNLRRIIENMASDVFFFKGIRHATALHRAERFIWKNYTRKISLKEIAGASGLAAPYFSSIFKEEMKENLSAHLNRLRAEKAAIMLSETELPLDAIAKACGFADKSWFSKIFKNFSGMSPSKYRKLGGNTL
ncbi:MAG: PocR ligand-binding domain-containing protein [Treponema sp.]|nr:PocR ligand-binding domain-containing protein [Treponema sp.]